MIEKKIYDIALSFRSAIIAAKMNREFSIRDRMNCFPRGCCDDSCDLFSYYLENTYGIYTRQANGVYRDSNPYNTTNHAWLVDEKGIIIDITADQFDFVSKSCQGVYVGNENLFYKQLDDRHFMQNYNIEESERLWNDYEIITNYLVKNSDQ